MITKNDYFEQMIETASAHNKAAAVRRKQREAMINTDDWDGVRAFDEREKKEFPYPFTSGANKALAEYDRNIQNGTDAFEISELPWDYELADFINTLRKAGIATAVVTDHSTGLMDGIYGMNSLGCRMNGLKTITRSDDHRFGSKEPERRKGIEFKL